MGLDSRLFKPQDRGRDIDFLNIAHFPNSLSPQGRTSMLRTVSIRLLTTRIREGSWHIHLKRAVRRKRHRSPQVYRPSRGVLPHLDRQYLPVHRHAGHLFAWAKVRRKRYFYGNTLLGDSAFEYLADRRRFSGRIVVVGGFAIYSLVGKINPIAGLAMALVFLGVLRG